MDTLTVPSLGSVNNSLNTGHRRCRASQYSTPSFHRLCSEYGANTVLSLMVIFPVRFAYKGREAMHFPHDCTRMHIARNCTMLRATMCARPAESGSQI